MTRRLRYQVACSLDGFIAGPRGEYDWIVDDASIDMTALFKEFDAVVMGRKTYDLMTAQGGHGAMPGAEVYAFSRTLPAATYPGVQIVNEDPKAFVAALKARKGRDIWLFGGGVLFRELLGAGLVDSVELAVMPVMLGEGVPVLPGYALTKLRLTDHRALPKSGIVVLSYTVVGSKNEATPIRWIKTQATRRPGRRAVRKSKRGAKTKRSAGR